MGFVKDQQLKMTAFADSPRIRLPCGFDRACRHGAVTLFAGGSEVAWASVACAYAVAAAKRQPRRLPVWT